MRSRMKILITPFLLAMLIGVHGADVVIDPTQTFQTIKGWGHGGGVLGGTGGAESMLPSSLADPVNYQISRFSHG